MESPSSRSNLLPEGLSSAEAAHRLDRIGPNEIRRSAGPSPWRLFASQIGTPLVLLLLAACALSLALGDIADSIAIAAIVVVNAAIGVWHEHRARNAVLALRAMTAPRARLVRDGHVVVVPAAEVVPGDLLLLEAGDVVAADAKLVEVHDLQTNEAAITGESLPVDKDTLASDGAHLAERHDRVFLGTQVSGGKGTGEVVATGMQTELGRIALLLEGVEDPPTPLQVHLARLGRWLMWMCLATVGLVAVVGVLRGQPFLSVVILAVALAVAAVPEGLPAIVTIALSIGVQRMAARNVLIRHLPAVETLGSATVICTDKTGTLTTGQMAVRESWGPDPSALLRAAASCCDAEVRADGTVLGSPTEVAILREAHTHGIERDAIEARNPRVEVHPFDPKRKRMSILREDRRLYVKGALDGLIPLCTSGTEGALEANAELAGRGLRVLAVAVGYLPEERELRLVGLLGLADPPRTEAIEAISAARKAGITTVMITGDHPLTAEAIAREMGIVQPGEDLASKVFARATPEDKLRLVRDWRERGAVVAMTGDGVNDAPALREAHIGIAMGKGGTEVTREAADMVLADDDFASIVVAVREGRGIWENIRKTVVYLLGGNTGELLTVLGATLVGLPTPLLPLQLLWINLVTDGLPAVGLVMDPPPPDALDRAPRPPEAPMLGRTEWRAIATIGLLEASIVLATFAWVARAGDTEAGRHMAFAVVVFCELFRAFAARSPNLTFWEVGALSNLRLVAVVLGSAALQVLLYNLAATQTLFHLAPLSAARWAIAIALGLIPVSFLEIAKLVRRRWRWHPGVCDLAQQGQ